MTFMSTVSIYKLMTVAVHYHTLSLSLKVNSLSGQSEALLLFVTIFNLKPHIEY